jgi:DNA-directed RNA polymerase subunit RPC12/RpoP
MAGNSNIISIGDWKIQRKGEHRLKTEGDCDHKDLEMDEKGDVVRCLKCGTQVSAFWALRMISGEYTKAWSRLEHERATVKEAKDESLHLLASRKVEKAWRKRSMVPACPHCSKGIFPEDGFGNTMINREIELRRRKAATEKKMSDCIS